MATRPVSVEHRLFIVREDWRDVGQYPETIRTDPTIGAWELLRRNNKYAQDYAEWQQRVRHVPPVPFPRMSLNGYFCIPEPAPGTTYEQYRAKHPNHLVLPVLDYIREKWGITHLIDPKLSADKVIAQNPKHKDRNQLAWLFACTSPEIINPPTHWPDKNYLDHASVAMLTSGFCTGTEVMVRFDFTGKFDVQMESLRDQIGAFFEGGTRSGSYIVGNNGLADADMSDLPATLNRQDLLAVRPNWNTTPVYPTSLRNLTRFADLIGSLEAGTLEEEILEKRRGYQVGIKGLDLSINADVAASVLLYAQEHMRVRGDLTKALVQYFDVHPLDEKGSGSATIKTLLEKIYLFAGDGHVLVARLAKPF